MNTARATGGLATGGRNLVDWLTGAGFLMLHATCFFVALIVLIPWNLYTEPGDFWVANPLIRWAFLLAFHALLVGVWSLIRNVILKDEEAEPMPGPASRTWQTARAMSTPVNFRTSSRPSPVATSAASALLAEEWARQWLAESEDDVDREGELDDSDAPAARRTAGTAPAPWPDPPAATDLQASSIDEPAEASPPLLATAPVRTPGPLGSAARAGQDQHDTDEPVDPELEWRWIEAAASAWLTRKERETFRANGVPQLPYPGDDSVNP